jgi:hypothetical protein
MMRAGALLALSALILGASTVSAAGRERVEASPFTA